MKNNNDIEKYLLDRMTKEEKSLFEARLQQSSDLRKEVELMKDLILSIESYGLKKQLKKRKIPELNSTSNIHQLPRKNIFHFQKWAIAASILGIALCTWWFMKVNNSNGLQDQYAQVFFQDPGLPTTMSETDYYSFYDAMVDYKYGNYQISLDKWNSITEGVGNDTLTYYKAMANLGLNNLDKSKTLLQSIGSESQLYYKANWYLIDILAREGNFIEAKERLKNMVDHPDYDKEKALTLLNSMQ